MKIKNCNLKIKIVLIVGILLRIIFGMMANPEVNQHDVIGEGCWFEYALYVFKNWSLPMTHYHQFHQPPLNPLMQALFMKFISLFRSFPSAQLIDLFSYTKILQIIYSIITLHFVYKITDEFDISDIKKFVIVLIVSLYPGYILLATQYSNDGLAFMFVVISLYLTILWYKKQKMSVIIILAITISLGMLTKISAGIIAFITGPIFIVRLINTDNKRNIIMQLIIFVLICIPLSLSYELRNYFTFGLKIGSISRLGVNNPLNVDTNRYDIFTRILSFPISRFYDTKATIYHSLKEYNIWIDLIKTSIFDESNGSNIFIFDMILLLLNILFYISTFVIFIVFIIKKIISIIKNGFATVLKNNMLLSIGIVLYIIAIVCFVIFNIKYPTSCSSNWRYIPYITFAQSILLAYTCDNNL